jgi:V/A-type H+-transporting ATPase subunit E
MAITDITNAIIKEAEKQASDIVAQAHVKTQKIEKDWEEKIVAKKQELIAGAQNKARQKVMQTEFKLHSSIQTELLNQKRKLLDKVYNSVAKKLSGLSDDQYVSLMEKLIDELPGKDGELFSTRDKEDLLKKALKKSGKSFEINKETVPGTGGFIFRSKEVEIDNTVNSLVEDMRQKTELEVSKKLFNNA